jgi:hypothetical protein
MTLKRLILNRKLAMNIAETLIEPLMDVTAVVISITLSMIIPSILSKMPVEFVHFAVAVTASVATLTVADLKEDLLKKLQRGRGEG